MCGVFGAFSQSGKPVLEDIYLGLFALPKRELVEIASIVRDGEHWQVTCEAQLTAAVRTGIEEAGITVESSDLTMLATSTVELDSVEAAKAVLRLVDALEDHDDVQHVYANMDIADDVLAAIDA